MDKLDERFDAGQPVSMDKMVLDRNDFSTDKEMDTYFKDHPEAPRQAYDYYLKTKLSKSTQTLSNVRVAGTEEYILEGLPSTNVVQNTYLGTSYLYAIQQHNDTVNGSYQLLSRFPLSGSTTLQCQDYMRINRFGHGQTLQWFDNASGTPYFWVVTKATLVDNPSSSASYDWGTQIGRVQYEAGATIDYTNHSAPIKY